MAEAKKGGSTFGEIIGCMILVIAILAIVFWFLVVPKMEEAGYSLSNIQEKATTISENVVKTVRNTSENTKDIKNDTIEKGNEAKENIKDTADEIKH
jgi:hypothetical protein